jgi:hypothetical protein
MYVEYKLVNCGAMCGRDVRQIQQFQEEFHSVEEAENQDLEVISEGTTEDSTAAARRTINTKKLATQASIVPMTASNVRIPAFIPCANAESLLPKQAAQANVEGAVARFTTSRHNEHITRLIFKGS